MMTTSVQQRRDEAAERMGVDAETIRIHKMELATLREAGLLVDMDVKGISMFTVKATYAELGIGATDVRAERLRAGRKDLFPGCSKKLRSLESRARANLERESRPIPAFGQYRWLPWTAYEKFQAKHLEILAELKAVKAEIVVKYDDIVATNAAYFKSVAFRAWRDLSAQFVDEDNWVIVTMGGAEFFPADREKFMVYVVERALSRMPSKNDIENHVSIDYSTSILYSEEEAQHERTAVFQEKLLQAQAELETHEARQKAQQVAMEMTEAQVQSLDRIAAFKAAEMAHAREQLASMSSPLQEALNGLRANLYEAVSTLLAGVRKNDGFRGQASNKAAALFSYWRRLNGGVLTDKALDEALGELDQEMKGYQRAKKSDHPIHIEDIEAQLVAIANLTIESARALQRQSPSRASALEL